jgi:ABC-2 type transport system permease protein
VSFQTVAAPVLTSLLYLFVFAQTLEGRVRVYEGVPIRRSCCRVS